MNGLSISLRGFCFAAAVFTTVNFRAATAEVPYKDAYEFSDGRTIRVQVPTPFRSLFAEHQRRLVVCDYSPLSCAYEWLVADFSDEVNLYLHDDGTVIVVNSVWMMRILDGPSVRIFNYQEEVDARLRNDDLSCSEAGPTAGDTPPASIFFKNMKYLGAFRYHPTSNDSKLSFGYREFRFFPFKNFGETLCRYPARG